MISAIWVNCMKFYKRVFVKMAEWLPDDVYLKLVYYAKFQMPGDIYRKIELAEII